MNASKIERQVVKLVLFYDQNYWQLNRVPHSELVSDRRHALMSEPMGWMLP